MHHHRLRLLCDMPPQMLMAMSFSDAELLALCHASERFADAMYHDQPERMEDLEMWRAHEMARDLGKSVTDAQLLLPPCIGVKA